MIMEKIYRGMPDGAEKIEGNFNETLATLAETSFYEKIWTGQGKAGDTLTTSQPLSQYEFVKIQVSAKNGQYITEVPLPLSANIYLNKAGLASATKGGTYLSEISITKVNDKAIKINSYVVWNSSNNRIENPKDACILAIWGFKKKK